MPWVTKHNVTSQTQKGEITINLNLTLSINQDGTVQVSSAQQVDSPKVPFVQKVEKTKFVMPILDPVKPDELLNFDS